MHFSNYQRLKRKLSFPEGVFILFCHLIFMKSIIQYPLSNVKNPKDEILK